MDYSKLSVKQNIFGQELSYEDLKEFKTVEKFVDTSHDTRSIVQDSNGTYYLYDFHEEMGSPNDYMYEHFFVLNSLEQGKKFAKSNILYLKANLRKFVYIGPNWDIIVAG